MSTRAFIGIQIDNEAIIGIYNHHDGYPSYVGDLLKNNYTDELKIWELISKGDTSSIGENVEDSACYAKNEEHTGVLPRFHKNVKEIYDYQWDFEYAYVWNRKEQKWYYNDHNKDLNLHELTDEVIKND